MATIDISGNAANPARTDDLRIGAHRFMSLLENIRAISDDTCTRLGDDVDGRDYKAIAIELETAFTDHFVSASSAQREGFLRAFTDFMAITADGCSPNDNWDPLASTAAAFVSRPGDR